MDFVLCQELLKQAERLGADDAAIVVEKITQHCETRQNGQSTIQAQQIPSALLYLHVGDGAYHLDLSTPGGIGVSLEDLKEKIQNGIHAARLANAWGTVEKTKPLQNLMGLFSAQVCALSEFSPVETPKCSTGHKIDAPGCFKPEYLLEEKPLYAPMLDKIETDTAKNAADAVCSFSQTTSCVDTTVYLGKEVKTQKRYETVIKQSIQLPKTSALEPMHLPDYVFDGRIEDIEQIEHKRLLTICDVWQDIKASQDATEDVNDALYGLILSPWVLGVLAHEARHLGVDLAISGKMRMDMSKCLYTPPRLTQACPGMILDHVGKAKPTRGLLFARVPSHTLIVDAPSAWIRRNNDILDIECMVAVELSAHQMGRHFRPVVLRFDLKEMWGHCSEIAEPSRRIALRCGKGYCVFQAPWAYFNMKNVYRKAL